MSKAATSCKSCASALSSNGNWRGGKVRHKAGYVMVRTPEHPRAKANNGYVFEHILVMEDYLGRHLYPGENIHHLNGVKDDNRLSNLELWVKTQPAGQRAKDLVEWAKEVLEKYNDPRIVGN